MADLGEPLEYCQSYSNIPGADRGSLSNAPIEGAIGAVSVYCLLTALWYFLSPFSRNATCLSAPLGIALETITKEVVRG